MQFIKQHTSLSIRNIDESLEDNEGDKKKWLKHGKLLPKSIRCIMCGPSNCGKTNVLIGLIENPNGLSFENVYIYSKSLNQPKYKYLKRLLTAIDEVGFFAFKSNEEIIDPENVRPNSIFIFDDVICDKQNNIKSYFSMGRHKSIDCFYLAQTYTSIPKHLIRDNANLLVLFKQDDLNLKHIYNDYSVACDMKFDVFRTMCYKCWREKYGFVVIDLDSELNKGRYRKGFDEFIHL